MFTDIWELVFSGSSKESLQTFTHFTNKNLKTPRKKNLEKVFVFSCKNFLQGSPKEFLQK